MSYAIDVLTIFPELFEVFSKKGLIGQAAQAGKIQIRTVNPRDFTTDVHRSVDDRPYGGGDGMVMMAEPLEKALATCEGHRPVIYLSPQGERLTDKVARELAAEPGMILISGRYGGVDERFLALKVDREISIGDYVLNGGEVAAMALIEAVSRFRPDVLGNSESAQSDSFANGLLEAPQMTRPPEYEGLKVPEVLLSGNHKAIAQWRRSLSIIRTHFRRPDLLKEIPAPELAAARGVFEALSALDKKTCGLPATWDESEA